MHWCLMTVFCATEIKQCPSGREGSSKATPSVPYIITTFVKRERRVVVIEDSLLRGTESPICRLDSTHRKSCSFPGAWVRVIPLQFCKAPWLLAVTEFSSWQWQNNKEKSKGNQMRLQGLGTFGEGSGDQLVIFSILPVTRNNIDRIGQIRQVSMWLWDWCKQKKLGFFDYGIINSMPGLLTPDGI